MNILILEDNADRIATFRQVLRSGAPEASVRIWRTAPSMINDLPEYLPNADLISLDNDLVPETDEADDPGAGTDVAEYMASQEPECPVILHTTNVNARWSMVNTLKEAEWQVEVVAPLGMGVGWIEEYWLPVPVPLVEHKGMRPLFLPGCRDKPTTKRPVR